MEETTNFPQSILVGSDLSEASDDVIRQAASIARAGGAKLHVVSAYAPPTVGLKEKDESSLPEAVLEEVKGALPTQLRRVLPDSEQLASQEVCFGVPAEVILERAKVTDAGLIVLGAHRGPDVHAQFLGTTADEVLRHADLPCLALRGRLSLPLHHVGVAIDFSAMTERVLACTLEFVRWLGREGGEGNASITAVHVLSPEESDRVSEVRDHLEAAMREEAGRQGPMERVELDTEVHVSANIASDLVAWAGRERIDVLVAGTHGTHGWRRGALGSTSSALARRAPCPVLLVPSPQRADGASS